MCEWEVSHRKIARKSDGRESSFSFTRLKNGGLFLGLVFTEDKRTVGAVVLGRGRGRALVIVSLGLVQQLRQAATAAKVDAKLVE